MPTVAAPRRRGSYGAYLLVWSIVGVEAYALYRPHGTLVAGLVVIGAGIYEPTPLKQRFRRRCRDLARTGFAFGVDCLGSSIGLMLVLFAVGAMSVAWTSAVGLLVLAQKLLPLRPAIDMPLALAGVALGALIIVAPAAVPGLIPSM